MLIHKATLIQDIAEYLLIIQQYLASVLPEYLEAYAYTGMTEESVVKWMVDEELELVHGLFATSHIHNHTPYMQMHAQLSHAIPHGLSHWTRCLVQAPKLYGDNIQIRTELRGRDLYLFYHIPPYSLPEFQHFLHP